VALACKVEKLAKDLYLTYGYVLNAVISVTAYSTGSEVEQCCPCVLLVYNGRLYKKICYRMNISLTNIQTCMFFIAVQMGISGRLCIFAKHVPTLMLSNP
jgi:hypothetical protein